MAVSHRPFQGACLKLSLGLLTTAVMLPMGWQPPALAQELDTITVGEITATLSTPESQDHCAETQIQIERGDQAILNELLSTQVEEGWACLASGLNIQDLDGDGEPEIFLLNYSGGAHCCFSSLIYQYDPDQNSYHALSHFWGNTDYTLEDLDEDGILEFLSHDDEFAYAFASYAGSRFPIQIWQYRQGTMHNVTRDFPSQVYADAYQQWMGYQELVAMRPTEEEAAYWFQVEQAALAAYLADKHLLGQEADGWQRVFAAYQWPDRESFFQNLTDFLGEKGYLEDPSNL